MLGNMSRGKVKTVSGTVGRRFESSRAYHYITSTYEITMTLRFRVVVVRFLPYPKKKSILSACLVDRHDLPGLSRKARELFDALLERAKRARSASIYIGRKGECRVPLMTVLRVHP